MKPIKLIKKLFGSSSAKELKAIKPIVDKIEALDEPYSKLTDEQLKAKTPEFKERLKNGETLDDILPEAFAACREAAWRVLGMKPYRVQLIGGVILHQVSYSFDVSGCAVYAGLSRGITLFSVDHALAAGYR